MSKGQFYCSFCHEYLEDDEVRKDGTCSLCGSHQVRWRSLSNMVIVGGNLTCVFCGADNSGIPKDVKFVFCWNCGNRSCAEPKQDEESK